MPDSCVSFGDVGDASEAPLAPSTSTARQLTSAQRIAEEIDKVERQLNHLRQQQEEEISRVANGSNYSGQQAAPPERREARNVAKDLVKELNETSRVAREENAERLADVMEFIEHKASVATDTIWQNVKNKVYGWFVSDRAEMNKWLGHFLDNAGAPQYMNPLISMYERINPTARSYVNRFNDQLIRPLENMARSIAFRNGSAINDICVALGHYACARHAPERNAMLLERWREDLRTELDKAPNRRDMATVNDLTMRIENLERFINSDLSDYREENFGRLYHAGYTNRQAEMEMERVLEVTGATREEADAFSDLLSNAFTEIQRERARAGTLDPNYSQPEFEHFVPMLSRQSEGFNNFTGSPNDATPYNPGSYYAIYGRNAAPDSAFVTLGIYAQRAATEIATRDFGFALNAIQEHFRAQGIDTHLRSVNYSRLMRSSNSGSLYGEAMRALYNRGGFVANVPVWRRVNGAMVKVNEKRFFFFSGGDFSHQGASFDTSMLNKALSADFKLADAGPLVRGLATGTGAMSQLTTRFTPLFSPVSGLRDFGERAFNMMNRTYYNEGGQKIGGFSLATSFLANAPRAGSIMLRGLRGELNDDSPIARIWREFNDQGLAQRFTMRNRVSDRSLSDIVRQAANGESLENENILQRLQAASRPNINRAINLMGQGRDRALRVIDGWNDYFQNLSAFTHYLTLREKGVSVRQASDGVLREMNMSMRGSVAPWLQALAPFIVPTVQSGSALMRTMGFGARRLRDIPKEGWKGYAAIIGAYGAYSMLMPMARDSMGVDENGNSRYDSLSFMEATRSLPIGLNSETGEYLRWPIGFGGPLLGATLAVGAERVAQGRMTASDLLFETLFATAQNIMPGNWPQYDFSEHPTEFIMTMLTPQPFRPFVEVNQNLNFFGNSIYNTDPTNQSARAMRGRTSTNRRYHEMAKDIKDATGADLEPEVYEHLERSFALGPLRGLMTMANKADELYRGSDRPPVLDEVHPLLASLGITSWMGKAPNPTRSLYYEAKRAYDKKIRELNLDMSAPNGSTSEEAEAWRRQQLQGYFTRNQIDGYIKLWKAEGQIQQLGRDFNREYKDRWLNMESSTELKNAFDKLADDTNKIYNDALEGLTYFREGLR